MNLDFNFIKRMGEVIYYDFAKDIPGLRPISSVREEAPVFQKMNDLEKCKQDLEYWRNKAVEYMEKYNQLLEENLQKKNKQTR